MSPGQVTKTVDTIEQLLSQSSLNNAERIKLGLIQNVLADESIDVQKLRQLVIDTGTALTSVRRNYLEQCRNGLVLEWFISTGVISRRQSTLTSSTVDHFPFKKANFFAKTLLEGVWNPLCSQSNIQNSVSKLSSLLSHEISKSHSTLHLHRNLAAKNEEMTHCASVLQRISNARSAVISEDLYLYLIENPKDVVAWVGTLTGVRFNDLSTTEQQAIVSKFTSSRRLVSANSKLDLDHALYLRGQWSGALVSFEKLVNNGNPLQFENPPSAAWFGDSARLTHYENWLRVHGLQQVQAELVATIDGISVKNAKRNTLYALVCLALGITILDLAIRLASKIPGLDFETVLRDYVVIQLFVGLLYSFVYKYFIRQQAKDLLDAVKSHRTSVISAYKSAKAVHESIRRDTRFLLEDLLASLEKSVLVQWAKLFAYVTSVAHLICLAQSDYYSSMQTDHDTFVAKFDYIIKIIDEGRRNAGPQFRN